MTGQRFGRWTVLGDHTLTAKGEKKWLCLCSCGNEKDIAYNDLLYGNMRSCGCRKKENDQNLKDLLVHIAGTSTDAISSKKIPTSNTVGCKGVYRIRGKYAAKIVFQKKQYYLGYFQKYEDAVRARKAAETLLFDQTAEFYAAWQIYADKDPEWARRNPVQISVTQNADRQPVVTYLPIIPAEEAAAQ